ncbi:MAG TPA: hypothetical protein PLA27_16705 [Anaerolineales bacterium]|jgi:hypothetical protein|nr:hypothetical protein [Anaerolineales bacterium]
MNRNISIIRTSVLILFVIALLGPWTFDQINVPAEYDCSPFIRLNGDFCGMPMSGVQFLWLWVSGFFYMIFELITGSLMGRARELLVGLAILPLIPFFTTLLLLWKEDTRQFRTVHLVAWVLALILALLIFIPQINDPITRLWGLWLYILLAVSAIVFEYLALKNNPASNV